jgi:CHAT domain-containing protein
VYRASNPLFSALRFADRWLTSAEVLDLELDGALVVLSACESGRPGHCSAEPVGLTWAFLAAGASGAIASQWLVDDAVGADFARLVHGHLDGRKSPAHAVRLAQLAIRERHPHPYHWAPFGYVASPAPDRVPPPVQNGARQ